MGVNEQETPDSGCCKWLQCYQAKTECDLYGECKGNFFVVLPGAVVNGSHKDWVGKVGLYQYTRNLLKGIYFNAPVKTVYLHTTVIHMKRFLLWHPSSICYVIKGQKLAMIKVSLMDCWNNRVNSQCLNNGGKSKR